MAWYKLLVKNDCKYEIVNRAVFDIIQDDLRVSRKVQEAIVESVVTAVHDKQNAE